MIVAFFEKSILCCGNEFVVLKCKTYGRGKHHLWR